MNEREFAELPEVLSDSFVLVDPTAPRGEVHGPDGIESLLQEIQHGFLDSHIEILDILACENVVMFEGEYTGTHQGEFQGLPPTGQEIDLQAVEKYEIESERIQRGRVYIDEQDLKEELGLTFPEVVGQLPTLIRGKLQANH